MLLLDDGVLRSELALTLSSGVSVAGARLRGRDAARACNRPALFAARLC